MHALRHTASAAWLCTGRPLMYVQRRLGHAQVTTTERLYGHLEETLARNAAADTEALSAPPPAAITAGLLPRTRPRRRSGDQIH